MLARMPAMINRLMPLPMPNSSICSPSHIRKTVPAVIVTTVTTCQPQVNEPVSLRNCGMTILGLAGEPGEVDPALADAQHHGGVARVFVDFLTAGFAFFLQSFQGRPDAGQQLEDDRRRDIGHDAQSEDRDLIQLGGAEDRDLLEEHAEPLVRLELGCASRLDR